MKKYTPYIAIAAVLLTVVVGYLIYRKKKINDYADGLVSFDGERQFRKNQLVQLNKSATVQQVSFDAGDAISAGTWRLRPTDKLYYVGMYNNFYVLKRKGWFFDRFFLTPKEVIK